MRHLERRRDRCWPDKFRDALATASPSTTHVGRASTKRGSRRRTGCWHESSADRRTVFERREALRRAHQRASDARNNFVHHVSKWLVSNYDLIAFEKLNIKGMVQGRMAKSILDAAWGQLLYCLSVQG